MHYRRVGFFALCSVALVGCGAAATVNLATPELTPTATMPLTPAEAALGQQPVSVPTIPDSYILSMGDSLTIGPSDHATISQAEAESIALNYTRSDSSFRSAKANSAVLAEVHDSQGTQATGPLEWIVDVTPSKLSPIPYYGGVPESTLPAGQSPSTPNVSTNYYVIVFVNAQSGKVLELGT